MSHCYLHPFVPLSLTKTPIDSPMRVDQRAYDAVESDYSIRFYTWPIPTVSIGRFQTLSPDLLSRLNDYGIPWVRRPTGGQAILHQGDLTFSVVGPLQETQQHHLLHTYHQIAQGLINGLSTLNISAESVVHDTSHERLKTRPDACYGFTSQADLRVNGQKFIGCAQVRRRKAFLQQGVLYLKAPHTLYKALFQEQKAPIADLHQFTGQLFKPETVAKALGEGLVNQLTHTPIQSI